MAENAEQASAVLPEYTELDALGLAELVRRRDVSPAELVDAAVARIEAVNPQLNAVICKLYEQGQAAAARPLPNGAFRGVPYLLKELGTLWQGVPLTNSCLYFKDFVAPVDMAIVTRIKQAGFVLIGKTNAPEYGWCLSTEPEMYGVTRNPWDARVTPGGSSGGAAAAVASRMLPLAEASDGAGSIRVPAANNGLVGLKPSRGRVSLAPYGDYWFGGAQFLCVSRTVRDTAAYLDAVAGSLPGEPYQLPPPARPFLAEVGAEPARLRIGFTTAAPDGGPVHPEVAEAVRIAAGACEQLGHDVEEHALSFDFDSAWKIYTRMTAVQTAMAFQASAPLVGHEVTESEVPHAIWGIIRRGHSISGVQHTLDIEALRLASRVIATDLAAYDVFLSPVLPQPPRPLGHYDMSEPDPDAYNARMGVDCVFTVPFNMSGQPAMALPLHWTSDGLPIGVQLAGRHAGEDVLFRLAGQLEAARPWRDRRPPISAV